MRAMMILPVVLHTLCYICFIPLGKGRGSVHVFVNNDTVQYLSGLVRWVPVLNLCNFLLSMILVQVMYMIYHYIRLHS